MERLTASPSGKYTDNSIRLRAESDNQIVLQSNYLSELTEITYQIGQIPVIQKTLTGGGIVLNEDGTYTITLSQSDNLNAGIYKHYIEITNDTGTYKASLDKGRVMVEN